MTTTEKRQRKAQAHEAEAVKLLRAALDGLKRHDYVYAHGRTKMALDKINLARAEGGEQ